MTLVLDGPDAKRQMTAYLNERREKLRSELEATGLEERRADVIRGRLAELKSIAQAITNEATND